MYIYIIHLLYINSKCSKLAFLFWYLEEQSVLTAVRKFLTAAFLTSVDDQPAMLTYVACWDRVVDKDWVDT